MSILFPKVNKMPQWDFRHIYYDPKKEEREKRRKRIESDKSTDDSTSQGYSNGLHRGSFREARENDTQMRKSLASRSSRLAFWIVLLALLLFCFYYLL